MAAKKYPSFANFLATNIEQNNMEHHMRTEFDADWIGGNLYKDADTLINDLRNFGGALPPIQSLYKPKDFVLSGSEGSQQEYIFDVYGESFDIGLVCEGVPEAWLCQQEIPTHKENLTIRILHGCSGGTENKKATEKYMAIADLYTAALKKYRVRVVIEWRAIAYKTPYHHEVMISDYTDYLDPLTLVSMCSITMFRLIMRGCSGMANGEYTPIVKWPTEWEKYFKNSSQTYAERVETPEGVELIIPPIHKNTEDCYNLENLLKAAGLIEEGE